ncbi:MULTISPECIES: TrkA family potassium uptake protein [unclassified Petrotoga]|uniref:potassium channel family protein n=1 Tax=unclassified Petrotoga TaxID=2620614 RepID=UPI000CA05E4B|nr:MULTISPECIES: potassium channel protein [unclassified Petrotoga]
MNETLTLKIRRFVISIMIFILIVFTGTVGYMILEDWAFLDSIFFTIITLSTVGYEIPANLSRASQIFTMALILSGITVVLYSLSTLTSFIVEGEMRNVLEVRKRMKKIDGMNNHYIVVGAGKTGFFVCQNLLKEKKDFVLLDKSEERAQQFLKEINEEIPYFIGDAKNETVLEEVGVKRADSIILTLPSDVDNLFVALTVKSIVPKINIISKVNDPESVKKLSYAGINKIVLESEISGNRLAYMATRPNIVSFLETIIHTPEKDLQLEEVDIPKNSWVIGKSLKEIALPDKVDMIVIAVRKKDNNSIFNPKANTIIEEGDVIIVLGEDSKIKRLREIVEQDSYQLR